MKQEHSAARQGIPVLQGGEEVKDGWHTDDMHGHLLGGPRPPSRFDGMKRWDLPAPSPEAAAVYTRCREQVDAGIIDDLMSATPDSPEMRQRLLDWYETTAGHRHG